MNYAAVDAGVDGAVEVEVPAEWANAVDAHPKAEKEVPAFVKNIVQPINACKGDDLPVSTFAGIENGEFPLGTSAYEKRGVATTLPQWDINKCIQCNQCSYVMSACDNPTILLNRRRKAAAPESYGALRVKVKALTVLLQDAGICYGLSWMWKLCKCMSC